jgi:hypothetical protein
MIISHLMFVEKNVPIRCRIPPIGQSIFGMEWENSLAKQVVFWRILGDIGQYWYKKLDYKLDCKYFNSSIAKCNITEDETKFLIH